MASDDRLSLILRRLDEIERKLDRWKSYGPPRPLAIQHEGAIFQRATDGPEEQIFGGDEQVRERGQSD
jgi:hypothetical protein